ncbi:hypothetical protein V8F33_009346 [Rhypophila sp. PSN 637]
MKSKARHPSITTSLFLFHTFILISGEKWKPGDPCPTEIRSGIPDPWHKEEKFGYMEIIHAAMLICPNIKILELYSTGGTPCLPPTEQVVWPFNKSVPLIERWASAPEVLILDDFDSDTIMDPVWTHGYGQQYHTAWYMDCMPTTQGLMEMGSNSSVTDHEKDDTREIPNGKKETNFDIWLQVMDFSRIHTLELGQRAKWWGRYTLTPRLTQTLPPRLVSLRKLELKITIGADFLLNLPKTTSLTHLTWREPWTGAHDQGARVKSLLVPIFKHHGSAMETLYLHAYDTGTFYRPALSTNELRNLTRLAPNINKLTIDLSRTREQDRPLVEDWPWEDLKILATSLRELTDLTVYFELAYMPCQHRPPPLPTGRREKYAQPMVSKGEGEKIARFLARERATVDGKPFRRIRIRSGNEGWGVDGGYMSGPIAGKSAWDWIDGKSSWISCFGKDWAGLPDEERNKVIGGKEEFVCFAGENLEELKEWEDRCRGVKRHSVTEGAWRTGDGHGHEEDGGAERRKWLVDSEREE